LIASGNRITAKVGFLPRMPPMFMMHQKKGPTKAHFGTTRSGKQFGGGTEQGVYWGPGGEPQFLKKLLSKVKPRIPEIIAKGMKK
jgi:hypothetical protein